jgi:hypothetical protein
MLKAVFIQKAKVLRIGVVVNPQNRYWAATLQLHNTPKHGVVS